MEQSAHQQALNAAGQSRSATPVKEAGTSFDIPIQFVGVTDNLDPSDDRGAGTTRLRLATIQAIQRTSGNQAVLRYLQRVSGAAVAETPTPPADDEPDVDSAAGPVAGNAPDSPARESAIGEFLDGMRADLADVQGAADAAIDKLRLAGRAHIANLKGELTGRLADVRQFFGLERTTTSDALAEHRGELQSAAVAHVQQLRAASANQVAVAKGAVATRQSQVTDAGQAQASTVLAQGQNAQSHAEDVFAQQTAHVRQFGDAAPGAYGGGEAGQAQGQAAQQVASKGAAAVLAPKTSLVGDLISRAREAAQKLTSVAGQVARGLADRLGPFTQWVGQIGDAIASAIGRAKDALLGGLSQIERKVLGVLRDQESRVVGTLNRLLDAAQQAVNRFIDGVATRLDAAVKRLLTRVDQKAQEVAAAARKSPDLERVAQWLMDARRDSGVRLTQLSQRLGQIEEGVAPNLAQQSALVQNSLNDVIQGARQATPSAAGKQAAQQLSGNALSRMSRGVSLARDTIASGEGVLTSRVASRAQEAVGRIHQGGAGVNGQLTAQVDRTAQANQTQVVAATQSGMNQAANQVGANYAQHRSMLSSVTASISQLWNAFKVILQITTGIKIPSLMYTLGVLAQLVSNQLGGVLDPLLGNVEDPEFHTGRDTGDRISMIIGAGEIVAGIILIIASIGITGGGTAVAVASGGTLAIPAGAVVIVVDTALVTQGVIAILAGIVMMMTGSRGGGHRGHKYSGMKVRDILKLKKGSIRNAPLEPGSPSWDDILDMTWEEIEAAAKADKPGFRTIKKLLTDGRFDR